MKLWVCLYSIMAEGGDKISRTLGVKSATLRCFGF